MAKLADILAAEQLEAAALVSLKAAVQAVPPAIDALKQQLAAGNAVTEADLDGIVAAMHSATDEITADTKTLTDATAPAAPSTQPPAPEQTPAS